MTGVQAAVLEFVFGVPPLVARVIWPDLAQVDFFKPYIGKNPQDLVFIGLCVQLLPNGLIGVFLAAMLAATMSTLSSVYNMVSSILSRDVYQGWIKPDTTDEGLLKVGRWFSVTIGLNVTGLAVFFVNSQFGIFNLMPAFFTLLNIPVVVPIAFGLLFRRVPKWSAVSSIAWGLIVGLTTRYVLGWDIGPQVYLAFIMSLTIFAGSYKVGKLYKENRTLLSLLCLGVAIVTAALFMNTIAGEVAAWQQTLAIEIALALVTGLVGTLTLSAAVQGYFLGRLAYALRVVLLIISLLLLKPGWITDLIGLVLLVGVVLLQVRSRRTLATAS